MNSNNDGQQSFDIRIDTDGMRRDAENIMAQFDDIGKSAVQAGQTIDGSTITAGTAMRSLSEAVGKISDGMKEWDFGTASEKMSALTAVMKENENILLQNRDKIRQWKEEAQEAFNNGDMEGFNKLTLKVIEAETEIKSLISETQDYAVALEAVKAATGDSNVATLEPIRLYDSEADLQEVNNLKEQISSLNTQIRQIGAEGGDTSALQAELDGATAKLNEMESAAADTASQLGNELAGRAAEAQQSLYELNQAIEQQQNYIADLTGKVEEAKAALEEIRDTEDENSNAVVQAKANYDLLNQSLAEAQNTLSALQGAQVDAQNQWQSVSAEVQAHDSVIVKMLGGYQNYNAILSQLPGPLQSVIGGINGMTGAAKAFIATPLGAVIAAIVLALQALKTWFDSSAEGQMAFAKISGYVSGVLMQLKEIVINVGKAIYEAFTNPKKAVADLWQAIKSNILTRIKSIGAVFEDLGHIIEKALDFDWDGVKKSANDMGKHWIDSMTGVEDSYDRIKGKVEDINDLAKKNAELNERERILAHKKADWKIEEARLDSQIQEARNKAMKGDAEAIKKAQALIEKKYAKEKELAEENYNIINERNSLASSTDEELNAAKEAMAQIERLKAREFGELRFFDRRQNSLDKAGLKDINQADANAVAAQLALNQYDKKVIKQQRDIGFEMEQARIDGMEEGFKKTLDQNELNYKKLIADNEDKAEQMVADYREKLMAEYAKENPNATQSDKAKYKLKIENEISVDDLPQEMKDILDRYQQMADMAYSKANKDVLDKMLQEVLTYEQQREKIIKEYAEREELLYNHDDQGNRTQLKDGVTQGNINELQRQRQEALNSIDEEFARREETYQAWCNQIATFSLEELNRVLERAKQELDELEKSGQADPAQLATARAKVNAAQNAVKKAAAKEDLSPGTRSLKEWQELYSTLNDVQREFQSLGNTFDGVVGDIISKSGQIASSSLQMINGIMQLAQFSITATKMAAEGASASLITLEKASVILTIISAAIQLATMVASLFNNDAKYEKRIEKLQDQIDLLRESYDRLGRAVSKAFSTDAAKLIEQQQTMLKQQQALIRQQIAQEQSKKNSDNDRIKEWQKELREIDDQIKQLEEDAKNAIFGEDIQSAIENFASAYESMFDDGITKAKASKDIVKDMIKKMIMEAIKMDISGPMEKLRDKMESYMAGGITDWELAQLEAYAEELMGDIQNKYSWADKFLNPDDERTGTSKGITTASQDSVDEMNARLTTIQGHTYSISQTLSNSMATATAEIQSSLKDIIAYHLRVEAFMSEMRGLQTIIIDHLATIRSNTGETNERLGELDRKTKRVADAIETIQTNGLKLK